MCYFDGDMRMWSCGHNTGKFDLCDQASTTHRGLVNQHSVFIPGTCSHCIRKQDTTRVATIMTGRERQPVTADEREKLLIGYETDNKRAQMARDEQRMNMRDWEAGPDFDLDKNRFGGEPTPEERFAEETRRNIETRLGGVPINRRHNLTRPVSPAPPQFRQMPPSGFDIQLQRARQLQAMVSQRYIQQQSRLGWPGWSAINVAHNNGATSQSSGNVVGAVEAESEASTDYGHASDVEL